MAQKKRKARGIVAARISDEELIMRLEDEAPEPLRATISEDTFDAALEGLLKESRLSGEVPHFYCRRCATTN
jgi:hypothetical protein